MSQAYDPTAPEDKPSGSQYISKKDVRVGLIGIAVLGLILYPAYLWGKANSDRAACTRNVKAMFQAMEQYALDKDDRFPVVYYSVDGETAQATESGLPRVWASDIAAYMNPRASFRCPAAGQDEVSLVEGSSEWQSGKPIELTYGMYLPYSEMLRSTVENPNTVVILAETANAGANGTYNPQPIGETDGFAIGWNTGNRAATLETKWVTRLAFPRTAEGKFGPESPGRHSAEVNGKQRGIIHAMTANGSRFNLLAEQAEVEMNPNLGIPTGTWAAPLVRRRR